MKIKFRHYMLYWTKGAKLNSSIVTNYFVAKSLSFLWQKFSSLNVTNSDENKSSLKKGT